MPSLPYKGGAGASACQLRAVPIRAATGHPLGPAPIRAATVRERFPRSPMRPLPTALLLFATLPAFAQVAGHPNYDDEVKPLFARRCFACHSAGEMRSGLNLETYAGVLKGGSSGDVAIAGRAASKNP